MKDRERVSVRAWKMTRLAIAAFLAAVASPEGLMAQGGQGSGTWTFSTDSANNLVVQDLESFSSAQGVSGQALCLNFRPVCPSSSERRANDLALARTRYTLRGPGGKSAEWRVELGQPTSRDSATILPFQVGVLEQGMVQVVSAPGAWSVDLQRIPAAELRVGDGKRWNVYLTLASPPVPDADSCWIEVACPNPG